MGVLEVDVWYDGVWNQVFREGGRNYNNTWHTSSIDLSVSVMPCMWEVSHSQTLFSVFLCATTKKNGKKRSGYTRLVCGNVVGALTCQCRISAYTSAIGSY